MKIHIRNGQQEHSIHVPTTLLLNPVTAKLAGKTAQKYAGKAMEVLSPQAMGAIFAELKRIQKTHGSWVLVEVSSASGKEVTISL